MIKEITNKLESQHISESTDLPQAAVLIGMLNANNPNEDTEIIYTLVSHWADFEKISGRKTNPTSQQRFFSTDVGMDFASQTVLDIKWGRA